MPTDKKVKNLVFNVLTEEQYESATKNEDEFYLTPDNSAEIEKVIPTDVAIKDNKLGLEHDSVWLTNQNAINLGEGLTYDEATKTLKAGGKSVSPTLVLVDIESNNVRTTITEEEKTNLENGLYNQVLYDADEEHHEGYYMPNSLIVLQNVLQTRYMFEQFATTKTADGAYTYSSIRIYLITLGEKNTSNEYPITITKVSDINPASSGGSSFPVIEGTKNASFANAYTIPATQTSPFILHIKDDTYNEDIYAVVNVAVDSKNRCDYYSQFTHNFNYYRLTGTDTNVFVQKIPSSVSSQIVTSTDSLPTTEDEKIDITDTINMDIPFVELYAGANVDRGSLLARTLAYDMSPYPMYIGQIQKFNSGKMGYYYLERISEKWYLRLKELSISGGSTEDSRIGDLTGLKTNAKDTIVNAINEVEEETDNIAKVTPTDIKIVNDEITLMHDGTEITGQENKIGTEATDLASLEVNVELPSGTTATLLTTLKIGDTYYKIIEPVAVEITAKADATNGTITDSQLSVLQASDSNYVMFNHEKFFLNDDGAKEGFLTYTHVGHENSKTTLKFFTITVSTKAWVLTTQSVQTINVIENSDDTVSLEIS